MARPSATSPLWRLTTRPPPSTPRWSRNSAGVGLALAAFDSLIAATARLHGLTLVTRDVKMRTVLADPRAAPLAPAHTDWPTP